MAEEKGLYLVQMCKENNYFPKVIAAPSECRKEKDLAKNETLDFEQYCFDGKKLIYFFFVTNIQGITFVGKVVLRKKKHPPFYTHMRSYYKHLMTYERTRNQAEVKKNLLAKYGEIRSFLAEKYPECRHSARSRKKKVEAETEES